MGTTTSAERGVASKREVRDERFARPGGQDHHAAPTGGFPRGEGFRLVRVRRVATGKLQRQISERAGLVFYGGALGGEGFDQRAVTVGGDAEAFDAVVPFGVLHPCASARRRVQQQRAPVVRKNGRTGQRGKE